MAVLVGAGAGALIAESVGMQTTREHVEVQLEVSLWLPGENEPEREPGCTGTCGTGRMAAEGLLPACLLSSPPFPLSLLSLPSPLPSRYGQHPQALPLSPGNTRLTEQQHGPTQGAHAKHPLYGQEN